MSDNRKKEPPERSESPLRDRVSFFEKVWTGTGGGSLEEASSLDVQELEKRLEERQRPYEPNQLIQTRLRQSSPRQPEEFQETFTSTVEEGDLAAGLKTVKFEKVTVRKTVRQVTSVSRKSTSRTPSEERVLEDSAYQTHSNGNISAHSSISSLTGRSPSDENLRTPSRGESQDECDSASGSSKVTTSSSEWYNEYRSQSFQNTSKLEYVRSKSQYDNHIAVIRGQEHSYLIR